MLSFLGKIHLCPKAYETLAYYCSLRTRESLTYIRVS